MSSLAPKTLNTWRKNFLGSDTRKCRGRFEEPPNESSSCRESEFPSCVSHACFDWLWPDWTSSQKPASSSIYMSPDSSRKLGWIQLVKSRSFFRTMNWGFDRWLIVCITATSSVWVHRKDKPSEPNDRRREKCSRKKKKVTVCCSFVPFSWCCDQRIILFFVEKEKQAEWNAYCVEVSYLAIVSAALFFRLFYLKDFLELFPLACKHFTSLLVSLSFTRKINE